MGRATERKQCQSAETLRKLQPDPPAPAIERIGPRILALGRHGEVIPHRGTHVADQNERRRMTRLARDRHLARSRIDHAPHVQAVRIECRTQFS